MVIEALPSFPTINSPSTSNNDLYKYTLVSLLLLSKEFPSISGLFFIFKLDPFDNCILPSPLSPTIILLSITISELLLLYKKPEDPVSVPKRVVLFANNLAP
ncbi:hypothetical protein [Brevundimonas diminuta]|uniref:hypothetical protein n=1 Tax=Brevundimonas diminuta TaxID=293 RepID=UPI0032085D04